ITRPGVSPGGGVMLIVPVVQKGSNGDSVCAALVVFLYHVALILGLEATSPWQLYTLRLRASTRRSNARPPSSTSRPSTSNSLRRRATLNRPNSIAQKLQVTRACCRIVGPRFRTFHSEGTRGKDGEGNLVYDPLHTHGPTGAGRERQD